MLFKVINDFECVIINADNPQGIRKRFRRQERVAGEKKEIWADNVHCNFMSQDWLALGMPLSSIVPDGQYRASERN